MYIRTLLVGVILLAGAAARAEAPLVKYSYSGAALTTINGDEPPWNNESQLSGYFIVPEIPPSTSIDFTDPDIEFPMINLPSTFAFTDGARTITEKNIEPAMKNTRLRERPLQHEIRSFFVSTDESGNIVSWDLLFVSHVLENTYSSIFDGEDHGQDQTQVQNGDFGCKAEVKCTANVNYTSEGPKFRGTTYPGGWTKEVVQ